MIILWGLLPLIIGFLLDLLIGDPPFFHHPVRLIGHLIQWLEKLLRKLFRKTPRGEFWAGVVFFFLVVLISMGVPLVLLWLLYLINPLVSLIMSCWMCYQLLATKSLKTESMKVYRALEAGDLLKSRQAVSMIVGRDTQALTEEEIAKATVETVAENTSDGIVAPLFYLAIGGPVLGFFYKSINTMDSMVGYKNERYLYFGRFAARMDDVVNYIPARLSALWMVVASFILGYDGKNAWRIYLRDRRKHSSPNAAQTEAVTAGALGVALAGDAYYFGKLVAKETIGDPLREISYEDIKRSNRLAYGTAILTWLMLLLLKVLILWSWF